MGRRTKTELAGLAAAAYLPFLLSSPGKVSADSKQALYLDPGGLLRRAGDLWDPTVGAGSVPHQQLGYLMPAGPWFWSLDALGVPDWVAQRLWWGTLMLLAALGARWLFRLLGVGAGGALAGALVYAASPYQLAFTARMSVLLLPWAALPWLVGCTVRATRGEGWRPVALLGVVLLLTGGVNASSLVLVALGPLAWLVVEATRGAESARRALAAGARVALVAAGVSAWWLVGIRLQGAYGLPILQLTENLRTVAEASSPGDVLRGLGNWFFYGRDRTGYSVDQADAYASDPVVVAVTYAIPMIALGAAVILRWAHRGYFVLLLLGGTVLAVGSWPIDDPSPFGRFWRTLTSETSAGLALRNSPRAVPLVVLGAAGLLAAAAGAIEPARVRRLGGMAIGALAVAGLLPVWSGGYLTEGMARDEELPGYWHEAAGALDAGGGATRVLELPGAPFAAYGWGTTIDPVTPSLIERPYLAREVLPDGGVHTVNLLGALDRRIQRGTFEPSSIAPVARLLGVGTVSLRADLDRSGRFDPADVAALWGALQDASGLAAPDLFGQRGRGSLPPVALFDVEDSVPIVRAKPAERPVVLAGDGDGVVDSAAAGALTGRELLLYGSALDERSLGAALEAGARLVVTDSHRRRIETWFYSIKDDRGPTERAGEVQPDPTGYDYRLDLFPGSGDDARTVVEHVGGQVEATGGPGPERPEERAVHAADGDLETSWRVGGEDPRGYSITITPDEAVKTDELRVVQAPSGSRRIDRIAVRSRGHGPVPVTLGPASLTPAGQAVPLPGGSVDELTIEILDTVPPSPTVGDPAPVGFAELRLGELVIEETVRPPVDLLRRVGDRLDAHPLTIVLTRLRDQEPVLDRTIELPTPVTLQVTGSLGRQPRTSTRTCRSDLVEIDGEPVPVELSGPGGGARFASCAPVELAAGRHRITPVDRDRAKAVDRIVLEAPVEARRAAAGPAVEVLDDDPGHVRARVDAEGTPFWFVLGQSWSDGWELSVDGGAAGPHHLADGHANGWLIEPDADGVTTVTARWSPQRLVPLGFVVTALTALACLVVLVRTRRSEVPGAGIADRPTLVLRARGMGASLVASGMAALAVGTVGLVAATPSVALVAAGSTVIAGQVPATRLALALAAPAALGISRLDQRPSLAWLGLLVVVGVVLSEPRPRRPGAGWRQGGDATHGARA